MQEIERSGGYPFSFNSAFNIRPNECNVRVVVVLAGSVAIISTNNLDTCYDLLEQANEQSTMFPHQHILHWDLKFRARKKHGAPDFS